MRKLTLLVVIALLSSATAVQAQGKGSGGSKGKGGGPHGHLGGGGEYDMPRGGGQGGPNRGGQGRQGPPSDHDNSARNAGQAAREKPGRAEHPGGQAGGKDHHSRPVRSEHSGERGKSEAAEAARLRLEGGKGRSQQNRVSGPSHGANWLNDDFRIRSIDRGRYVWHEPVFRGCPPGLAKKGNGCLPPGQARKLAALGPGYPRWFGYSHWYSVGPTYDWRYYGGYVYRVDPATALVRSIVPLLGGALFGGNPWPQDYLVPELPPYHVRYYGYDDAYRYRYADGVVYAVDPKTQIIQSVAALMTGQRWVVGSAMPPGYAVYNVPHEYRTRYVDSPSSWYRYDDGYMYEIDPTTQIVRRTIELLAI